MIKLRAYFYEAHAVDVVEAEQQVQPDRHTTPLTPRHATPRYVTPHVARRTSRYITAQHPLRHTPYTTSARRPILATIS